MPPADPPYALSLPVQEYTQGDYGHVIGRYVGGRVGHGGARAQHAMSDYHRYQMLGVDAGIGTGMGMDPNMKVLLESLRRSGVPFAGNEGYGGSGGLGPAEYPLGHGREGVGPTIGQGVAQARNGFTPAEELIFQAHAGVGGGVGHGLARDMLGRGRGAGIEVEERGVASAAHSFPQQQRQERIPRNVPVMSEDDFHSNAGYRHVPYGSAADGTTTKKAIHNRHIHPAHVNARLSRDLDTQQQEQEQLPIMASSYQQNQNQMHAHIRSTTLPQRSSSSSHIHQRHHQHSSMSIPISSNSSASGVRMNELQVQLQNQNKIQVHYNNCNSIFEHNSTSNNIHRASINTNINNTTINSEHSGKQNKTNSSSTHDSAQQDLAHTYNHVHIHRPSPGAYDVDISSPPLVSPALTYSSRTPATLSPATPFFGSFGHAGETFEGLDGNAKKAREVR